MLQSGMQTTNRIANRKLFRKHRLCLKANNRTCFGHCYRLMLIPDFSYRHRFVDLLVIPKVLTQYFGFFNRQFAKFVLGDQSAFTHQSRINHCKRIIERTDQLYIQKIGKQPIRNIQKIGYRIISVHPPVHQYILRIFNHNNRIWIINQKLYKVWIRKASGNSGRQEHHLLLYFANKMPQIGCLACRPNRATVQYPYRSFYSIVSE